MKITLVLPRNKDPKVHDLITDFEKKISYWVKVDTKFFKSKSTEDSDLSSYIEPNDYLVVLDERGHLAKNSLELSNKLVQWMELGKKRLVFAVGGPYGLSDSFMSKADHKMSLSPLTLRHDLASLLLVEQIYRGLSIWKGTSYHH